MKSSVDDNLFHRRVSPNMLHTLKQKFSVLQQLYDASAKLTHKAQWRPTNEKLILYDKTLKTADYCQTLKLSKFTTALNWFNLKLMRSCFIRTISKDEKDMLRFIKMHSLHLSLFYSFVLFFWKAKHNQRLQHVLQVKTSFAWLPIRSRVS